MVEIRPTLPGDSWLILANLRQAEVEELSALGVTSEQCMRYGLMCGNSSTVFIHGEPAGIFGVIDYGAYQVPWAVFTQTIDKYPIAFLRAARRWVKTLDHTTVNYIDLRNTRGVEWFRWLGFTVATPIAYGLNDELFSQVRLH